MDKLGRRKSAKASITILPFADFLLLTLPSIYEKLKFACDSNGEGMPMTCKKAKGKGRNAGARNSPAAQAIPR